ncbi:hypothetical protein QC761_704440 [Podospora bellae-mahoneyi]|uniref:FAD-binding PCMH-type domain-containing protein n=1 Tax=Podospora bellae-mahoneyi TaxID=2093777 RepID=A0ABR0F5I3_9PEZI|nr:hypothetical protein QC761_704440 [Podospora bellae-mahoneyi]
MGQGPSTSALQQCIQGVANNRANFAAFAGSPLYQIQWVKPYNLDVSVEPAAVVRPETAQDISDIIKCANANGVKVQAKSGGHSYQNYGVGGSDGAVAIDMVNFQKFSMDTKTWYATIGAGNRLGEVDKKMHAQGGRAMAHGVCPGVGLGGHATIGGLGPMSRMWGSALDHIVEVEVVTADGKIQRASATQNEDLFWALRGSASGFGVITEFVVRTHPEPANVVQYEYTIKLGKQADVAPLYSKWQALMADPKLDRRFGSMFIMFPLGAIITGTFYGTQEEFLTTGIPNALPQDGNGHLVINDWLGGLAHDAEKEALYLSGLAMPFVSRSLAFKRQDLLGPEKIKDIFNWVDTQKKGTLLWFIIFDAAGGAIEDVPQNATAFAHRDKIMYYQSYGIGLPVTKTTKDFITGFHDQVVQKAGPGTWGTYPGYVNNALVDQQKQYWDSNLPALEQIKARWDPKDLFHNPGSVRPAKN